jgi:hypothetical protein
MCVDPGEINIFGFMAIVDQGGPDATNTSAMLV